MVEKNSDAVMCIHPYMHDTEWVFDDPAVGLDKEPFVNGADLLIDRLVANLPEAWSGFDLCFSDLPFEEWQVKLEWDRHEADGNWYYCETYNDYGWLCPALLKYFPAAPQAPLCQCLTVECNKSP